MQFTNPIALWALLGLTLPVAIHLLSRKEGKVIRIGSLRHLQETTTQQFKGIRLNEIVLLSLRSLMVFLFVLLISGLSFHQKSKSETQWIIIEKGLENHPEVKTQLEKFQDDGFEAHWLADGFPLLHDSSFVITNQYRELIEKLSTQDFSEAIVIAQNKASKFSGMRPALPSNVKWISIEPESTEFRLSTIQSADSVFIKTGHSSSAKTYFRTQRIHKSSWGEESNAPDTLLITLVSDNTHLHEKKIVEACLRSIEQSFPVEMRIRYSTPDKINNTLINEWIIWLADQNPQKNNSIKLIYSSPVTGRNTVIQEANNTWRITKLLNEEVALHDNLTIQFASILVPSEEYLRISEQHDARMIPDSVAWNKEISPEGKKSFPVKSADSYLVGLLLVTLIVERLLAYHRNQ